MPELALAWVLRRMELASAIIGSTRPEQVHANAAASGVELSPSVLDAVEEALGEVPVRGQTLAPPGNRRRAAPRISKLEESGAPGVVGSMVGI